MSDVAIRAALEKRLDAMAPALATVWENMPYEPVNGTPYQKVDLLRAQPENPTIDSFVRKHGIMQVSLFYEQMKGPGAAEARADAIVAWFPYRLSLIEAGVTVFIDGTPWVKAGSPDGDRWMVPVLIPYHANF